MSLSIHGVSIYERRKSKNILAAACNSAFNNLGAFRFKSRYTAKNFYTLQKYTYRIPDNGHQLWYLWLYVNVDNDSHNRQITFYSSYILQRHTWIILLGKRKSKLSTSGWDNRQLNTKPNMSLSIIYSVICIPYSIRSFMKEEKNGNHYYAWYLCKYCTRTVYICVATRRLSHLCIHKLLGTNNCKRSNRLTRVVRCNPNANWLLATYLTKSTKT